MIFTILFPMVAGSAVSLVKIKDSTRNCLYAVTMIGTDLLCLLAMWLGGDITPVTFSSNVVLNFTFDNLGKYFLVAGLILYTAVCFYAFEYMKMEERTNVFFAFFFASLGALISLTMAGNLITMYFCFEILTISSVPLVLHELSKEAVTAGLKYLFYSIAGALLGLLAVFFIYFYSSGDTAFVAGGFLDASMIAGHERLFLLVVMAGILGFGTKAGMFPMHGWLPAAHPIAPAPASALLSGIIAKAGVFALIRMVYYAIGPSLLQGTWVQYTWMTLCMLTIFMGSMMAFCEKVTKKRLAFSTISQISYILLGLSFLSQEGLEGGLLHLMGHAASKGCLFLAAGVFIYKLGVRRVEDLKGIGAKMPVTMLCFTVVSLSLVGIPPMGGFLSKWVIASAAISSGIKGYSIAAPVVLLISALLTAGYLFTVAVNAFYPGLPGDHETSDHQEESAEPSLYMLIPMICLCVVAAAVGIWGRWILGAFGL